MTAFVHAIAPFLDRHADAFAAGGKIDDERWRDVPPPVKTLDDADGIFVFARAVPGDAEASVVVHLVDWRKQPRSFEVALHHEAFHGRRPLHVRLFTPILPYDAEAHDRAFRTKDYTPLVRETELGRGFVSTFTLPALTPWGVLVVEPDTTGSDGTWTPPSAE